MSNTMNNTQYFDLHVKGIGYLNRIREVPVKKGSFLACSISALRGSSDEVEYTVFDCRVSGEEAQKLVRRCIQAVEAEKKVLIGFNIGDIYPETFVYSSGKRKGETGVSLKGRLLHISFIKVDGKTAYQAEKRSNEEDAASADTASQMAPASENQEPEASTRKQEVETADAAF